MCGICGIVHSDPAHAVDVAALRRMNDVLVHRGPDDQGMFVSANVGLAMRRLSIIDLQGGHQPVQTEDGRVRLVFNGEIYNYRSLRVALQERGHRFASRSDTETIVHGFEEYGSGIFEKLRGMFAVAIWDMRRDTLVLATDRFGIKPLYYASLPDRLVFASELAALYGVGSLPHTPDVAALAKYFTFGYIPHPVTVFEGVKKLAPASVLEWSPGCQPVLRSYWYPPRSPKRAEKTAVERPPMLRKRLREALRDAVRSHLESDVPIGVFLSGGMDSTSIVALMSEVTEGPIRTFSIGFEQQSQTELELARLVANRFSADHTEIIVKPDAAAVLPTLVRHFGEPFADSSALPTYFVSRAAREHVKVALSGDGGDELFLGYTLFRGLELARRLQAVPAPVRRPFRRFANRARHDRGERWHRVLKRTADSLAGPREAYRGKLAMPGIAAVAPFLTRDLRDSILQQDPFDLVDRILVEEASHPLGHPLQPYAAAALQFSLPADMLVKVDRTSMANSLEVRVPFLDHELAEFVLAIPIEERLRHWRLKALLRDTMADALPREIVTARKRGFTLPLTAWFRDGLTKFAADVLLAGGGSGLVDRKAVETLVRGQVASLHTATILWSLVIFELWSVQLGGAGVRMGLADEGRAAS
jgi:asparagine synthase (glutamine-hydrolysing)